MGFWDVLLGRSKPVRPDLDQLFGLPSAAVTLEVAAGLKPTGLGSVCFSTVEGGAFKQLQRDVRQLLDADRDRGGIPVEFSQDEYGYTWLLARHAPEDLATLVNDLHAVNTLLAEGGFGPQLLCSLVGFHGWRPGEGPEDDAGDAGGASYPPTIELPGAPAGDTAGGPAAPGGPAPAGRRAAPPATGEAARSLALVYLYKRGTFYPFAPVPGASEKRDSSFELEVRGMLTDDLPVEKDLSRWFPVWGAPGL